MNGYNHCNTHLFPHRECLTSGNNHSDSDLSLPLSQYATHTDFVSHFDKLISNDLSFLHCNIRSLYKNIDKLENIISTLCKTTRYYSAFTKISSTIILNSLHMFIRIIQNKLYKTSQFALPKTRSNSWAKTIKCCAIENWSRIPLEINNKTCLALFLPNNNEFILLSC